MARPKLPIPSLQVNVKFHLRPGEDDDLIRFFADLRRASGPRPSRSPCGRAAWRG